MPYKILIVDDEPLAAQALARMCALLDHQPIIANNAGVAVRHLRQNPPDLVFLDMDMPQFSGIDLCNYIKHDPRLKAIPVVFVSANDQDQAMWEGMKAGAADYLVKPLDFDRLEAVLDKLLGTSERR